MDARIQEDDLRRGEVTSPLRNGCVIGADAPTLYLDP